jgi:hypothetical protein
MGVLQQGSEVWSHETHGSVRALLDNEAESGAARVVAVHDGMPCALSWLDSSTRGCPICRVPILIHIEKLSGQILGLIVMSHWLGEVWIWIWEILIVLPLSLFHLENCICLSFGVQVIGAAWQAATRIVAGVGNLVHRTRNDRTCRVFGDQTIRRSGDVMCDLHRAHGDEKRKFFDWASKPMSTVCQWFGIKTARTVFSDLLSKSVVTVSPVWTQNQWRWKVVEGFTV